MKYKEIVTLPTLDVQPFDPWTDTIVIEGIKYSGGLLRGLGIHGVNEGALIRIVKREDGIVWLKLEQEAS